ncbi:MAG: SPFH domain-containing protein [Chloroflexota bacterium]|nr:SPFH domain-containing protein [Anaerolineae bacterium]
MMPFSRRTAAIAALCFAWLVVSAILFPWQVIGWSILASVLTFVASAVTLRELYGGGLRDAIVRHFRLLTGLDRRFQIIREGRTVIPAGAGPVTGPLLLIVGPENCVILESGPRQTRISGPDIFRTKLFEYVRAIYDLRQRQWSETIPNVMTADLMETTVAFTATYGIRVSPRARRGEAPLTPSEINMIQQVDSWMQNWEAGVRSAIEVAVRQAVGSLTLRDVLLPDQLVEIARSILDISNQRMRPWGVEIHRVVVESMQPEQQVKDATASRWLADTETETATIVEMARAAAWRNALQLIAAGYLEAKELGMTDAAIHREVLRRTLEQMATDPATKIVITPELDSALSDLRRSIGLQI